MIISKEQYNKLPEKLQKHFSNGNIHPTVKNVALCEYLINMITKEKQIVLDPFMGSGTTGIACANLNRKFIGIEKEPEYMKIAEVRIKYALQQPKQKPLL